MATNVDNALRAQLINRREKLENAIGSLPGRSDLASLLHEVDAALGGGLPKCNYEEPAVGEGRIQD